jgi:hypothetical protein
MLSFAPSAAAVGYCEGGRLRYGSNAGGQSGCWQRWAWRSVATKVKKTGRHARRPATKRGTPFVKVTRLSKASHTRVYKQEERPVLYTWKVIIQYGICFCCVGVGQANIDCNWGNFVAGRLRH